MIILVGESAAGKSTVESILADKYGYEKTISYTTRPPRKKEKDGLDYHFISEDMFVDLFNAKYFCETGGYNGWLYGTRTSDYNENTVCVLTPHGLRQIKKNLKDSNINIYTIYIKVPRRDRLIKILKRGDDVDEAIRRIMSDVGQFDGIEDEVDFVIENPEYKVSPETIAKWIINKIKRKQKG